MDKMKRMRVSAPYSNGTVAVMGVRHVVRIVVHCSGGPATQTAAGIRRYHTLPAARGGRGWRTSGYHYVVEADGRVVQTEPHAATANGAKGFNHDSLHICYVGGVDGAGRPADTRTAAQRESLRLLIAELRGRYGALPVYGHRDLSPDVNGNGRVDTWERIKACPSFDAADEYNP